MTTPERNPYSPPSADVEKIAPHPELTPAQRRFVQFKAVLVGVSVDIGGTIIVGVLLSIIYGVIAAAAGESAEQIATSLRNIPHDSWLYIAATFSGLGFSLLGGYLCARIAKGMEYRAGSIQAACSLCLGLFLGGQKESFGMQIALSGLSVLVTMLGVKFGAYRNRAGA
ncbi:MAG: hypothetical protein JWL63_2762 [Rhodocyclales bacterium]|nr:hypothetical protein [Rhodocyclales bacterium]